MYMPEYYEELDEEMSEHEPAFIEELREISDYLRSDHVGRADLSWRLDKLIEEIEEHYENSA
jgi:hypothetical protein